MLPQHQYLRKNAFLTRTSLPLASLPLQRKRWLRWRQQRWSVRHFILDHANRNERDILRCTGRDGGRLARRSPIIKQAFRYGVPSRYQAHFATFRVDLGQ